MTDLEKQIELLRQQLNKASAFSDIIKVEDTITLTKAELASLIGTEVAKQTIKTKEYTLEEVFAILLSEEERSYLAKPDIFKKFPNYLLSDVGKPVFLELISKFRSQYAIK